MVQLFIKLYPEQLQKTPAVETLVQSVWSLVGSNKLPGVGDDAVSDANPIFCNYVLIAHITVCITIVAIHFHGHPLRVLQFPLFCPRNHLFPCPRRRRP